jgi:16S rRNA (guanine527-N7)-methyltransferase
MGLSLTPQQVKRLLCYLDILEKWNKAYNLTAVRDKNQMLFTHILDSLSISTFIKGKRILDAGTGAGLPGVPLAIIYPNRNFTLLDSNGKKIRFLFHVKKQLELNNLNEVQSRLETYIPKAPYDSVTSRALSNLSDIAQKTEHLLVKGGRIYAMKGRFPQEELSILTKHYKVVSSHKLLVPGIKSERHLIEIEP